MDTKDKQTQAYDLKSKEETVYQTAQNSNNGIQISTAQSVTGTVKSVKGQIAVVQVESEQLL